MEIAFTGLSRKDEINVKDEEIPCSSDSLFKKNPKFFFCAATFLLELTEGKEADY